MPTALQEQRYFKIVSLSPQLRGDVVHFAKSEILNNTHRNKTTSSKSSSTVFKIMWNLV